jgi:biotin--protein ligase
VLCGSTYSEGFFRVTVGVGLNVANRDPTTCVDQLLAAAAAQRGAPAPPPVRRERLLALVLSRYEALEAQFVADRGFHSLQAAYLYHWLHSAQSVTLMEEARQVTVTLQGLTQQGYLLAVDAAGERFELHPDGNSLDFFQGLVRRKLKA